MELELEKWFVNLIPIVARLLSASQAREKSIIFPPAYKTGKNKKTKFSYILIFQD